MLPLFLLGCATALAAAPPLAFEPNRGQAPPYVHYLAHAGAYTAFIEPAAATLSSPSGLLRVRVLGGNRAAGVTGASQLPGVTNYFTNSYRGGGIPSYRRARVHAVYPRTDLEYHGSETGELEYDWILAPGADANRIRFALEGAAGLTLNANGDLYIRLASGTEWIQRAPIAHQERGGRRVSVACRYRIRHNRISFQLAHYDRRLPLVIDPVLVYQKSIGGSTGDIATAVAVDPSGNVYIAGTAQSFDLPPVNAIQAQNSGTPFVLSTDSGISWTPIQNDARQLGCPVAGLKALYATQGSSFYVSNDGARTWQPLSNSFTDEAGVTQTFQYAGLIVPSPASADTLYAAAYPGPIVKSTDGGRTWTRASLGIPTTSQYASADLLTIDPFHPDILYADFDGTPYKTTDGARTWAPAQLPGLPSVPLRGSGLLTFDPFTPDTLYLRTGDMYRSTDGGATWTSMNFPDGLPFGFIPARGVIYATSNRGVLKTNDGTTWQRLGPDVPTAWLAVDPFNPSNLIAVNSRSSDGGKTWNPLTLQRELRGALFDRAKPGMVYGCTTPTTDAFVTKLNPAGDTVLFATYLGGGGTESATAIALDAGGNVYVAGYSNSADFPVTRNAAQAQGPGPFVASLSPDGATLRYATFSGPANSLAPVLAVDASGSAIVAGYSQPSLVQKLSPDGWQITYTSSIGGFVSGIAADAAGGVVVTGQTFGAGFTPTPGAFQTSAKNPDYNGFVARLDASGAIASATFLSGSGPDRTTREVGEDQPRAVALDRQGKVYVTGSVVSADFPVTPGAYDGQRHSGCPYAFSCIPMGFIGTICTFRSDDVFVTKMDASLSTVESSTLLGSNCYESAGAISLDSNGNVFIAGQTNSNAFPTRFPIDSAPPYSSFRGVVAALDPGLNKLLFSTYADIGGAPAIAAGKSGETYVAGANSSNRATLLKLGDAPAPPFSLESVSNLFYPLNGAVSPGEVVALSLSGFSPAQNVDLGLRPAGPADKILAGTRVLFDGVPAPVLSVAENRIVCVTPFALPGAKEVTVHVEYGGAQSNALRLAVQTTSVALMSSDGTGTGLAAAWNEDGTPNSPATPAANDSVVTVVLTGAGQTVPPGVDGAINGDGNLAPALTLRCDGLFAGRLSLLDVMPAPGWVAGIFEAHVRVHSDTGSVELRCGLVLYGPQTLTIAVK